MHDLNVLKTNRVSAFSSSCDYERPEHRLGKWKVHLIMASGSCKPLPRVEGRHTTVVNRQNVHIQVFSFFKDLSLPSKTFKQNPPGLGRLPHLILVSKSSLTRSRQTAGTAGSFAVFVHCIRGGQRAMGAQDPHMLALREPRTQPSLPSPIRLSF